MSMVIFINCGTACEVRDIPEFDLAAMDAVCAEFTGNHLWAHLKTQGWCIYSRVHKRWKPIASGLVPEIIKMARLLQ